MTRAPSRPRYSQLPRQASPIFVSVSITTYSVQVVFPLYKQVSQEILYSRPWLKHRVQFTPFSLTKQILELLLVCCHVRPKKRVAKRHTKK